MDSGLDPESQSPRHSGLVPESQTPRHSGLVPESHELEMLNPELDSGAA